MGIFDKAKSDLSTTDQLLTEIREELVKLRKEVQRSGVLSGLISKHGAMNGDGKPHLGLLDQANKWEAVIGD